MSRSSEEAKCICWAHEDSREINACSWQFEMKRCSEIRCKNPLDFILRSQKCSQAVSLTNNSKTQNGIKIQSHMGKKNKLDSLSRSKPSFGLEGIYQEDCKGCRQISDSKGNWTGLWEYFFYCSDCWFLMELVERVQKRAAKMLRGQKHLSFEKRLWVGFF